MKFEKIIKKIIVKGEEHPLSRLYGYELIDGKGRVIESEAEIIALVINNIAIRSNVTVNYIPLAV